MPPTVAPAADRERHLLVLGLGVGFVAGLVALFVNAMLPFAWAVSLVLTLSLALGAMKNGSLGPFRTSLTVALLVWIGALTLMQVLPATTERLFLGFTPAVAAGVYLLWLMPLFAVTLPYAWHFEDFVLTRDDQALIEKLARERR